MNELNIFYTTKDLFDNNHSFPLETIYVATIAKTGEYYNLYVASKYIRKKNFHEPATKSHNTNTK